MNQPTTPNTVEDFLPLPEPKDRGMYEDIAGKVRAALYDPAEVRAAILADRAQRPITASQTEQDTARMDFIDAGSLHVQTCYAESSEKPVYEICIVHGPIEDDSLQCIGSGATLRTAIDAAILATPARNAQPEQPASPTVAGSVDMELREKLARAIEWADELGNGNVATSVIAGAMVATGRRLAPAAPSVTPAAPVVAEGLRKWLEAETVSREAVEAYNAAVRESDRHIWPGTDINAEFQVMSAARNKAFLAMHAMYDELIAAHPVAGSPEPMPASEAAKQADQAHVMPPFAAPAVFDLPQLPTQPEELHARWKCENCDGRGHDGELHGGDHFQPPEPGRCSSCDGSGQHETAALLPEQAAEYGKACFEAGSRFRAEGGITNDSTTNLAAPAAPTDAKPDYQMYPVEPTALAKSVAEIDAWLETDGYEPLTVSQGESVLLVLRELKRLQSKPAAQSVRDAAQPNVLIESGALRQYRHNDGSDGFVFAYDKEITDRVLAAQPIAPGKEGA